MCLVALYPKTIYCITLCWKLSRTTIYLLLVYLNVMYDIYLWDVYVIYDNYFEKPVEFPLCSACDLSIYIVILSMI